MESMVPGSLLFLLMREPKTYVTHTPQTTLMSSIHWISALCVNCTIFSEEIAWVFAYIWIYLMDMGHFGKHSTAYSCVRHRCSRTDTIHIGHLRLCRSIQPHCGAFEYTGEIAERITNELPKKSSENNKRKIKRTLRTTHYSFFSLSEE